MAQDVACEQNWPQLDSSFILMSKISELWRLEKSPKLKTDPDSPPQAQGVESIALDRVVGLSQVCEYVFKFLSLFNIRTFSVAPTVYA